MVRTGIAPRQRLSRLLFPLKMPKGSKFLIFGIPDGSRCPLFLELL